MTYILGWKNYSSVFLVADSVITIEHPNSGRNIEVYRNQTSFGENHIYEEGKTISEKWLKLYDLENKVIIAISGTVEEAHEGIKYFKMYLENKNGIEIQKAIENSFRDKDVEILVGFMEEDVPRLISYNGKKNSRLLEHNFFEVAHSGSIDGLFIKQSEDFFSQIDGKDWSEEQILASIITVAQSYCFQEDIIKHGVGGFFSGIRIDRNGVKWQPDLMFIPFCYNGQDLQSNQLAEIFGEAKRVLVQVRESVLFSCSPFIENFRQARRPFFNYQPEYEIDSENSLNNWIAWQAKWIKEVIQNCDEHKAEYYIFYNTKKPIVGKMYSNEKKPFIISGDTIFFKKDLIDLVEKLFSPQDLELTLYIDFDF